MFSIIRPYIFSLDPEVAHDLAINSLKANFLTPENLDTLSKTHVLFEWEQEPLTIEYNLQISDTEIFEQIICVIQSFSLFKSQSDARVLVEINMIKHKNLQTFRNLGTVQVC